MAVWESSGAPAGIGCVCDGAAARFCAGVSALLGAVVLISAVVLALLVLLALAPVVAILSLPPVGWSVVVLAAVVGEVAVVGCDMVMRMMGVRAAGCAPDCGWTVGCPSPCTSPTGRSMSTSSAVVCLSMYMLPTMVCHWQCRVAVHKCTHNSNSLSWLWCVKTNLARSYDKKVSTKTQ